MSISSKIKDALKNRNEVVNRNEVEFTSSDLNGGYDQWRQAMHQAMQPYMTYTKAAMAQSNQAAMQVLMDNPGSWLLCSANVSQDSYNPIGAMDLEMNIKFLDPAVCQQFYGILSGAIQSQPIGGWNLTITAPRLDDEDDEDTTPGFGTQDEGKYITSFKEAM